MDNKTTTEIFFIKAARNQFTHTCTVSKAIPRVTWVTGAVVTSRDVGTICQ